MFNCLAGHGDSLAQSLRRHDFIKGVVAVVAVVEMVVVVCVRGVGRGGSGSQLDHERKGYYLRSFYFV